MKELSEQFFKNILKNGYWSFLLGKGSHLQHTLSTLTTEY